jgi:ParB family chromosome partitioning protein
MSKTTNPTATLNLLQVDPRTLTVRDQARADATPDTELIDSIRRHGIMQPPTVTHDPDTNGYAILIGHRRVGAAIAAGLKEITVIVRTGTDADEAVKLEQQIVENERRKALTASELAQGYKRLELFGRTPADIAAELGEKPERVKAGLAITQSVKATEIVDTIPTIDLEQAAIIAEFDGHPKLQQKLVDVATHRPQNFTNEAHSVRREVALAEELATIKAAAKADGVRIVETLSYDGGSYWSGPKGLGLTLGRLAGTNGPMSEEEHRTCPGHAWIITGAWHIDNIKTLTVCTDWQANGHTKHTPDLAPREKTPEEIEAAERAAQEHAERQKAHEARNENTRARRQWLRGFLNGRLNQTAGIFDMIADGMIHAALAAATYHPVNIAAEILTGTNPGVGDWSQVGQDTILDMLATGKVLPLRLLAATGLAYLEDTITFPWGAAYLTRLEGWGYTLTDIDRELIALAVEAHRATPRRWLRKGRA